MDPRTKFFAYYLAGGAATLAWSTVRAGQGQPVWPGFLDASGKPPGAGVGAAETIIFWPFAAYYNATTKAPAATTTTPDPSSSTDTP